MMEQKMSDPEVNCKHCKRKRNPMLHMRASFPPDAAKAWLKRTCTDKTRCLFGYRAGFEVVGRAGAMAKPTAIVDANELPAAVRKAADDRAGHFPSYVPW